MTGPGSRISSSAFSRVGSSSGSFRGGLNSSMSVVGGYDGPEHGGHHGWIHATSRRFAPRREQMKSLNIQFASFIDKVRHLEQQNRILETKWGLLLQQKTSRKNTDNMFESSINNLWRQLDTLGQEKLKLERDEIKLRADRENEFALIKEDVDEAYVHKIELESRLEGLTHEISLLRQLSRTRPAVLPMDNGCFLDLDGIIAEVKAQYEDTSSRSRAEAETTHQIKGEELQTLAGKHGDDLCHTQRFPRRTRASAPAEIETLKNQRAALEPAIADAEQRGELASKDANAKVAELEAALQQAKQDLVLDLEIATHRKLLEGRESRLESGMQNMSIQTLTTSSYSGGLNLAYGGLTSPGLNCGQISFQSSFGPGGSFSCNSSCKAVVVKKIKTQMGSWCMSHLTPCPSEPCPSHRGPCPSHRGPSQPPCSCGPHKVFGGRRYAGEPCLPETYLRLSPSPQPTLRGSLLLWVPLLVHAPN
ncbi:unnamed protein product [Nyctereutes procyonoides]|uniref:Keratin, type II cytoskeletal 8 n=1 Tax=Nyctereutes procyonoides TaxID=34880 RepID=A0A811Y0K5_NYCPR|nr:unnamed protein product [Nyctereutes procyonoides]